MSRKQDNFLKRQARGVARTQRPYELLVIERDHRNGRPPRHQEETRRPEDVMTRPQRLQSLTPRFQGLSHLEEFESQLGGAELISMNDYLSSLSFNNNIDEVLTIRSSSEIDSFMGVVFPYERYFTAREVGIDFESVFYDLGASKHMTEAEIERSTDKFKIDSSEATFFCPVIQREVAVGEECLRTKLVCLKTHFEKNTLLCV